MAEEKYRDPVLTSSAYDVRQFLESSVWQDMEALLNEMIYGLRNQLSQDASISLEQVRYVQGQLQCMGHMKALPRILLVSLEQEQDKGDV